MKNYRPEKPKTSLYYEHIQDENNIEIMFQQNLTFIGCSKHGC